MSRAAAGSFARRPGADRQRVDPVPEQVRQGPVDRPLTLDPAHPGEALRLALHREVALAAAVVAGMAAMGGAVVGHDEMWGMEGGTQAAFDLRGNWAGERVRHRA